MDERLKHSANDLDLPKVQLLIKEKSLNLKKMNKKKCGREGRRGAKEGGRRGKGKSEGNSSLPYFLFCSPPSSSFLPSSRLGQIYCFFFD